MSKKDGSLDVNGADSYFGELLSRLCNIRRTKKYLRYLNKEIGNIE